MHQGSPQSFSEILKIHLGQSFSLKQLLLNIMALLRFMILRENLSYLRNDDLQSLFRFLRNPYRFLCCILLCYLVSLTDCFGLRHRPFSKGIIYGIRENNTLIREKGGEVGEGREGGDGEQILQAEATPQQAPQPAVPTGTTTAEGNTLTKPSTNTNRGEGGRRLRNLPIRSYKE